MIIKFKKNENKKLSPHFNSNELQCRCSRPDCVDQLIDEDLLKVLEDFRLLKGGPLNINRAYSCPEHNKAIGGGSKSKHLSGHAVDIRGKNILTEAQLIQLKAYQEDPAYTPTWTHLQTIPPGSGKIIFKP